MATVCTLEQMHPPGGIECTKNPARHLQLETRGVTEHHPQAEIWPSSITHAESVAAKLRSIGRRTEANKLTNCHTEWTIATCKACGTNQKFPNRCENFYCPKCHKHLSAKRKNAIEWWTKLAQQPKHVVLTVRNVPDLTKAHVRQFKGWLRAIRRTTFAKNWIGGFYSLEVTNEGSGWHLHAHLIVDARWIDTFALSDRWQAVTSGFGRIVKVKDARQKDYLREVTKYAVKGNQLAAWQPEQIATFIDAFTGVRTFGVFGSLYGKRTEWRQWLASLKDHAHRCKCGCQEFWYRSEIEVILADLTPTQPGRQRPPPPEVNQQPLDIACPTNNAH